jgi:hypothetical protein
MPSGRTGSSSNGARSKRPHSGGIPGRAWPQSRFWAQTRFVASAAMVVTIGKPDVQAAGIVDGEDCGVGTRRRTNKSPLACRRQVRLVKIEDLSGGVFCGIWGGRAGLRRVPGYASASRRCLTGWRGRSGKIGKCRRVTKHLVIKRLDRSARGQGCRQSGSRIIVPCRRRLPFARAAWGAGDFRFAQEGAVV